VTNQGELVAELPFGPSAQLGGLAATLGMLKQGAPLHTAVDLNAADSTRYEDLVRVIDVCVGSGFPDVSLTPKS
jgi:hypothetical protein